jgi:hypothetical protein
MRVRKRNFAEGWVKNSTEFSSGKRVNPKNTDEI